MNLFSKQNDYIYIAYEYSLNNYSAYNDQSKVIVHTYNEYLESTYNLL